MRKLINYWMLAAGFIVALSLGTTACSSEDGPDDVFYNLAFVDEADAALDVDPEALTEQIIKITTDASVENISVAKETEQSWCTATVKSNSEISITAGANASTSDREAKFVIQAGQSQLRFSVTQAGVDPENVTLSIESSDIPEQWGMYMYVGDNKGATISVKVTTNAARWKAEASAMMGEANDIVITKARGKSGESMTFYLEPSMTEMLYGTIKITAGDQEIEISIQQMTMAAATSFKLFADDKKTSEFKSGTSLAFNATFDKDDTTEHIKTFYVTTDGGYVVLICKSGTEDEVTGSAAWLEAGGNLETLRVSATSNTTGAARSLDIVIADSDYENVLFRIPVTQAAK